MVFQKFICWGTFHHLETFVFCLQGVWYELSCGVTQHLKKSSRGRFWPKILSYRALAAARSTMAEHNVWWKRIVFVFAVTVTENGKQELLLYIYSLYSSQLWIFVAKNGQWCDHRTTVMAFLSSLFLVPLGLSQEQTVVCIAQVYHASDTTLERREKVHRLCGNAYWSVYLGSLWSVKVSCKLLLWSEQCFLCHSSRRCVQSESR